MALIHVNRDRQTLGQFTEQEVADGLASGRFLPQDLAWREPMPAWQPLSSFTDLPAPSAGGPVAATATITETVMVGAAEPPWERAEGVFAFQALVDTVRAVLSAPQRTFSAMDAEGSIAKPLRFYVLIGWITGAVAIGYQAAATAINPELFAGSEAKNLPLPFLMAGFAVFTLLLPLFLMAGTFISAGIMHVALLIVGGANKSFRATYRALAYAHGATSVAQLLPICGSYVYTIASLVYGVIALKEAHKTSYWRPVFALLLCLLFCCGLVSLLVVGFAGVIGALAHGTAGIKQ